MYGMSWVAPSLCLLLFDMTSFPVSPCQPGIINIIGNYYATLFRYATSWVTPSLYMLLDMTSLWPAPVSLFQPGNINIIGNYYLTLWPFICCCLVWHHFLLWIGNYKAFTYATSWVTPSVYMLLFGMTPLPVMNSVIKVNLEITQQSILVSPTNIIAIFKSICPKIKNCEIMFISWIFNFIYFVDLAIHKFKKTMK